MKRTLCAIFEVYTTLLLYDYWSFSNPCRTYTSPMRPATSMVRSPFVASGKHNLNHSRYDSEYLKSAHIQLLPATSHHVALLLLPRTTSNQHCLRHSRRAASIRSHHLKFGAEETQARTGLSTPQLRDLTDQDQNITLLYH